MVTISNEEDSATAPEKYPGRLSDTVVRGLEFTVAVSSEEDAEPTGAPMLDALTTYREEQLN